MRIRERERERNRVIFRDVHSLLVTRRVCKSVLVKIRENVFSSLSCDRILLILGRKTFSRTNSSVLSRIVILDYYRATSVTIFRGVERRLEVGVKSCIAEASRVCNINASSSKSSPNFLLEERTFGWREVWEIFKGTEAIATSCLDFLINAPDFNHILKREEKRKFTRTYTQTHIHTSIHNQPRILSF